MNLLTFDLNLMRVLDALLREGSTVRAGQRIGLSQPAVSAALGRLRLVLGDELFLRRGQGLEATDYARSIEIPLREALDNIEALFARPKQFDPMVATTDFKISGSDFFAELLMPRLADQVFKRAPGIRVQLLDLVPDNYVETLERYEVDIALIPDRPVPDWVEKQPVFWSNFSVIARQRHPRLKLAGLKPGDMIPIDLFCDLGHILFSPEGKLRAMGDKALDGIGRERRVVMTMPVFSGVYRSVSESDLIALLPHQLARWIAPKVGLSIYQAPIPITPVQLTMVWHKRSTAAPDHRWLRELIAEALAPLNEGQPSLAV
ncbi:LysR family transcriptional regulator [Hoeflea sp. Naph1]|uniref:LysR family transcriptional regulator n=1 Tax=Hoeflea sp. Naph1 TaxID=3388653 RepID=UPI003990397B